MSMYRDGFLNLHDPPNAYVCFISLLAFAGTTEDRLDLLVSRTAALTLPFVSKEIIASVIR